MMHMPHVMEKMFLKWMLLIAMLCETISDDDVETGYRREISFRR